MKKKTIRLSEKYIRESMDVLQEAVRIGLKPDLLVIEYHEYIRELQVCIDNIRALDPDREIILVSGEGWPYKFIVRLEEHDAS